MKTRIVVLAIIALLSAGCATTPPVEVPAPAVQRTATGAASTAPAASGQPVTPATLPMPMPDGKDMLWPTISSYTISDANDTQYWTRYGFIDTNANVVRPEQYVSYVYCVDDSARPAKLAATNQDGSVDVFNLDGSAALTIPAPKNDYVYNGMSCDNNEIWTFVGGEGQISSGIVYDAETGKQLRTLEDQPLNMCDYNPQTISTALPSGYRSWLSDEWAVDVKSDTPKGTIWDGILNATKAIDVTTSAVVPLSKESDTSANGPYLSVSHKNNLTEIYDRNGKLTPFGSVIPVVDLVYDDYCATKGFQAPYYWATSGRVQGYVDDTGAWHYQESADQTLGGD